MTVMADQPSIMTHFMPLTASPRLPMPRTSQTTPEVQSYFDHAFEAQRLFNLEPPLLDPFIVTEQEVRVLEELSSPPETQPRRWPLPIYFRRPRNRAARSNNPAVSYFNPSTLVQHSQSAPATIAASVNTLPSLARADTFESVAASTPADPCDIPTAPPSEVGLPPLTRTHYPFQGRSRWPSLRKRLPSRLFRRSSYQDKQKDAA